MLNNNQQSIYDYLLRLKNVFKYYKDVDKHIKMCNKLLLNLPKMGEEEITNNKDLAELILSYGRYKRKGFATNELTTIKFTNFEEFVKTLF